MAVVASTALNLARWQFAVTTIYHFLFVPVTIGMAWFVAGMQTLWHISGKERYLRMTRFFGKLFLINFALGVVTGIVQEFQFGMNWSDYSRYVGHRRGGRWRYESGSSGAGTIPYFTATFRAASTSLSPR
jgi:cytochrome bd-type quinol oxidase subunit 1